MIESKNKKKLAKLVNLFEKGDVAIMEHLLEIEEKLDAEIPNIKDIIARLKGDRGDDYVLTEEDKQYIKEITLEGIDYESLRGKPGENYILTNGDKDEIAAKIKVPVVKETKHTIEKIVEKPIVTNQIKEIALHESSEKIRDKLEELKGDERLDISAIKGVGKKLGKISDDILNRAIGILDSRTSFLINKVSNLQEQVNRGSSTSTGGGHIIQDEGVSLTQRAKLNFKGAAVTATDDVANDATIVTISAASVTPETPTGSVNGSNADFVFTSKPTIIVSDGSSYQENEGWTWTSGTLTATMTSPPTFDIFGYVPSIVAGTPTFIDNEVVSGSGTTFTLASTPTTDSVHLYGQGQRLKLTTDYSISGDTITTVDSWSAGQLIADYRT
jgi:hypothetical protein